MTIDITTNAPPMLTGFTEFRNQWGGEGIEGAIPLERAREIIGWVPHEARVWGQYDEEIGEDTLPREIRADRFKMLVHPRTKEVLGIHGSGYTVHPYEDTLLHQAQRIADGELGIARVGQLGGGRRAFVQYEMTENVTVGSRGAEDVSYRPFLNAASSLDGSTATAFFVGTQIIICDNILKLSLKQATKAGEIYKVRHTRNSGLVVADAQAALKVVFKVADEFEEQIKKLTSEYVSDDTWSAWLDAVVPVEKKEGRSLTLAENKRASLNRLWNADERVAPWKNSAWGVLAAANTWLNHEQTVRNTTPEERQVSKLLDGTFEKHDAAVLRVLEEVR